MEKLIFYAFAALVIISSLMVITSRNAVRAVLFLVMAFVASSGLWILLHAEFLGIILVLVYVGAVMVLFLFVVMMLDIDIAALQEGFTRYVPLAALAALLIVGQLAWVFMKGNTLDELIVAEKAPVVANMEQENNTTALGRVLYTDYVVAFEVAAVLLLVAMIAAVSLTLRGARPDRKTQSVSKQVSVTKADRLRIVSDDK